MGTPSVGCNKLILNILAKFLKVSCKKIAGNFIECAFLAHLTCFPHFFWAQTKIYATTTREAERFVDSGVLRQMASFEVSIPDFIEIHPILSFAAWQFRVSFIGAAPPRPIPGDGVEVSPVAKPPCKSLGRRREKYFCNWNSRLVAKPPCKSLGRRNAPGAYGLESH